MPAYRRKSRIDDLKRTIFTGLPFRVVAFVAGLVNPRVSPD
jgi:hypothetical protein